MNILRKLNPFRRPCCEVPLMCGDYETPGSTVSGIAVFEGHTFEFVGVMLGGGIDHDKVGVNLDVVLSILNKASDRGAWDEGVA